VLNISKLPLCKAATTIVIPPNIPLKHLQVFINEISGMGNWTLWCSYGFELCERRYISTELQYRSLTDTIIHNGEAGSGRYVFFF